MASPSSPWQRHWAVYSSCGKVTINRITARDRKFNSWRWSSREQQQAYIEKWEANIKRAKKYVLRPKAFLRRRNNLCTTCIKEVINKPELFGVSLDDVKPMILLAHIKL